MLRWASLIPYTGKTQTFLGETPIRTGKTVKDNSQIVNGEKRRRNARVNKNDGTKERAAPG